MKQHWSDMLLAHILFQWDIEFHYHPYNEGNWWKRCTMYSNVFVESNGSDYLFIYTIFMKIDFVVYEYQQHVRPESGSNTLIVVYCKILQFKFRCRSLVYKCMQVNFGPEDFFRIVTYNLTKIWWIIFACAFKILFYSNVKMSWGQYSFKMWVWNIRKDI